MNVATFISFGIITGLIAFISWYNTRRERINSVTGFFLANRKLNYFMVGSALLMSNISASHFIGENESVFINNMSVMSWGMTSVFAMVLVSEFILPVYFRAGIVTTPDFLEIRYDTATKRIVSVIFLIGYVTNLLPSVLYSGAVALNGLFRFSDALGVGYWTGIWILVWGIGSVGCLYIIRRGLKSVVISDTLLGVCMFAGGILLPYYALTYLGDGNFSQGLSILSSGYKDHFNSIGTEEDNIPFSTLFTGMLLMNFFFWGTEQYIVQQTLASKSLVDGQKGMAVASFGKIICPLLLNVPGLIALHVFDHMDNSVAVYPLLVNAVSPPVFQGFMGAVVLGAAISTFTAGLNSASTLFSLNLYQPLSEAGGKKLAQEQIIKTARRFQAAVCICVMIVAPFIIFARHGFYYYVQMVGGAFSVPIFTIVFVGMISKRVPAIAAKIGLIFSFVTYLITQIFFDLKIHFLHVLAILFVASALLMFLIGKMYPRPEPFVLSNNAVVDLTGWKHRHLVHALLLLLMVLVFVLFSPLGLAA
jgi:SSS family solute:Na+ symporter